MRLGRRAALGLAVTANNMNFLSIWAIQRDNGGCPGTVDSNTWASPWPAPAQRRHPRVAILEADR